MLSKRLLSLVKYVNKSDSLIDIGCDHALLDIYLVKNAYLKNIIASDIHASALEAGEKNIKKNKLTDKIETRLGNGLEVLNEGDNINTILISGMGSSTILNILASDYLKNIEKMIIQSNNNHEMLRREVIKLGFIITAEEYFIDNKKNYINIVFTRGKKKYNKNELRYGPFLIRDKEYLNFELNNCLRIKKIIGKPKLRHKISLDYEIRKLKRYIDRGN